MIGCGSATVLIVLFELDDKRFLTLSLKDDEDEEEEEEEEDCFFATGCSTWIITTFPLFDELEDESSFLCEDDDGLFDELEDESSFLSEDDDCLEAISAIANLVFSQGLEELLQSSRDMSVDDEELKARASRFVFRPSIRWKVATQRLGSPEDLASLWGS
ncbi:MAG: hypothetical protein KVP17_005332 [Porospora cf. gigantea B]|uniref:uncharacterized protein n=1 Tax=Porospora cf. gigantea B TaxID=2853592 RepID=UPI003571F50B|nr:MAG: hypothetical protein KVP17_005332 [Porospora cf. gigantea B]